jgi:Family of unknown function (DUF6114)
VTAYRARSGKREAGERPTRASSGQSLANARRAFRIWRRTRPFWGGLLVIIGACEMLVSERAPFQVVTHIGVTGLAGYLIPSFILLCGVMLWFVPIAWIYYSLLTIVLALASWITSNLGGFLIGMVLDIVGGSLAFAWTTDADHPSSRPIRGEPRIALPSWARDLTGHVQHGQLARPSRAALDWKRVERQALPAPPRIAVIDTKEERGGQDLLPAQPSTQKLEVAGIATDGNDLPGGPPQAPRPR